MKQAIRFRLVVRVMCLSDHSSKTWIVIDFRETDPMEADYIGKVKGKSKSKSKGNRKRNSKGKSKDRNQR